MQLGEQRVVDARGSGPPAAVHDAVRDRVCVSERLHRGSQRRCVDARARRVSLVLAQQRVVIAE
jgi:hypothetical protein